MLSVRRNKRTLIRLAKWALASACLATIFFRVFFLRGGSQLDSQIEEDIVPKELPALPNRYPEDLEEAVALPLSERKDWHNYTQIALDEKREGPGEQGKAVILTAEEEALKDTLFRVNGFNAFASDKIALDRSIPDIRHPQCKKKEYLRKLPVASVVVPFHNEHWSTLLRTAISVLKQSPPELIKEIILVDDASTKEHCKGRLDEYLAKNLPKVRVLRAPERVGLIRARLLGAKAATGEVLIFLDSHSEANVNWLPPLLEPIALDKRTAVCPFIDVIDFETFVYRAQDEGARGAFDWELYYKRLPLLPEDLARPAEPFKSPVMAGGLFAIGTDFFWELGGYDDGLQIWGGEQYELSFKIWQCGGQMVDHPCSRVGHIYRKFAPFPNPGIGDFIAKNYRRVAEVWMDEYAEFIYMRRPNYKNVDPGDLEVQKGLRQKLKCKSFKWFMETVAFDLTKRYPPVEPGDYATGEIRNVKSNLCIDTKFHNNNERFTLERCNRDDPKVGGEQQFQLSWHKDIRPMKRNLCFDVPTSSERAPVVLWNCHGMKGNQLWKYDPVKKWLMAGSNKKCMDCDPGRKEIFVANCDIKRSEQQWAFQFVNESRLAEFDNDDKR